MLDMKKLVFTLFISVITFVSCTESVTEMVTYTINEPVFMTTAAIRSSVKVTSEQRPITSVGKMCFYNNYLYISEPSKGIHIIDNRNPSNPQNIGFVELLGNADLAIRDNKLYADSYMDLVWFDISNPSMPSLKGRLDSIFPVMLPVTENNYRVDYKMVYEGNAKGIVVGWKTKERKEDVSQFTGGWGMEKDGLMLYGGSSNSTVRATSGINGSMSRFSIYNDKLYSVVNNYMNIFELQGDKPQKATQDLYIGRNVETIFSYKENMFMGAPTGLLIYSVKDPLKPIFQSSITHVLGCDPVVVENDIAYVTVHSGNFCGQDVNDLIVIDVANVQKPKQVASYAMKNPKGLGIDNGKLFLCDDGLKIFNVTDPQTIIANRLAHYTGMDGYDLIAYNNVLMMIADNGIYQYNYSDVKDIKFLSKMPIVK